MDADEVIAVALADDFHPFRVRTVDGRTIDVRRQGTVSVGRSTMMLHAPTCKIPDAKGTWYRIPYAEIESLQPIAPLAERNGE